VSEAFGIPVYVGTTGRAPTRRVTSQMARRFTPK